MLQTSPNGLPAFAALFQKTKTGFYRVFVRSNNFVHGDAELPTALLGYPSGWAPQRSSVSRTQGKSCHSVLGLASTWSTVSLAPVTRAIFRSCRKRLRSYRKNPTDENGFQCDFIKQVALTHNLCSFRSLDDYVRRRYSRLLLYATICIHHYC